jgi:hypothetical protein
MPKGVGSGGKRPGAGRPGGSPDKAKARVDEIMAKAIAAAEVEGRKFTPLERMLSVLNHPDTPRREKNDMAKAAVPCLHAKLNAIEQVITTRTHEQRLAGYRRSWR